MTTMEYAAWSSDNDDNDDSSSDDLLEVYNPENKSGKIPDRFLKLFHVTNPFQTLHDCLLECMSSYSSMTNINSFIKIIVSYVGYIESTVDHGKVLSYVACLSPNIDSSNETCIFIIPPKKSKDYNYYTISNIKFRTAPWYPHPKSKLVVNIRLFNDSLHVYDMQSEYKSAEILIPSDTDEDKPPYTIDLQNMNVTLKCGEIYLFWLDVLEGNFCFGYQLFGSDCLKEVNTLQAKLSITQNALMINWKKSDEIPYRYSICNQNIKSYEMTFC
eukprot:196767_1